MSQGKILIGSVIDTIGRRVADWGKNRVIRDYDEFCRGRPTRRALLSYLVLPLLPPRPFRDRVKFSNRGIAQEIPKVLNELGYSVDIVNYDNRAWLPDRNYDLFIGHGGINFEPISKCLSKRTFRIYFATGIYWRVCNTNIEIRAQGLYTRRGVSLSNHRVIEHHEESALNNSDGIICLGNRTAVETYSKYPNVIGINNAVFPIDWDGWRRKDFHEGRKHFLFFSGRGNILKGLDLLLESFAGLNLHLHVCQHLEGDFKKAYRKELTACPNIHVYGFVKMRSKAFRILAMRCNWVISPTCAEGQPGAILECMAHGLIPILSDEANIDIGKQGFLLSDYRIDTIRSMLIKASRIDEDAIRKTTGELVEETRRSYSAENFRSNLRRAISCLTESSRP